MNIFHGFVAYDKKHQLKMNMILQNKIIEPLFENENLVLIAYHDRELNYQKIPMLIAATDEFNEQAIINQSFKSSDIQLNISTSCCLAVHHGGMDKIKKDPKLHPLFNDIGTPSAFSDEAGINVFRWDDCVSLDTWTAERSKKMMSLVECLISAGVGYRVSYVDVAGKHHHFSTALSSVDLTNYALEKNGDVWTLQSVSFSATTSDGITYTTNQLLEEYKQKSTMVNSVKHRPSI